MRRLTIMWVVSVLSAGCSSGDPDDASEASELVSMTAALVAGGATEQEPSDPDLVAAEGDAGSPGPSEPAPVEPPDPEPDVVAAAALPIHALSGGRVWSEAKLYRRLARSRAICFGETHNVPEHHYAEHRALEALSRSAKRKRHPLAVGFEMFQRPFQAPLTGYVQGVLDEEAFLLQTEYATRWLYDFGFYRPLLERARRSSLPALALQAPRELTRKIGRTGLASLDAAEQAQLPELDLQDPEHIAYIYGLFGVLPGHESEAGLDNVYAAQVVWDESMADTAASWLLGAGDDAQLIAFSGLVHCHRSAIPRRLTRRTGLPVLGVRPILASALAADPEAGSGYDVLVVLEDE